MDQNIKVTTDAVIFCKSSKNYKILLVKRKNDPFKEKWALPGGFLEEEEDLETGAKRELKEETGVSVSTLTFLNAYGKPNRDPRGRTLSLAYYKLLSEETEVQGNDDAADAKWFNINELPELAFDHSTIIKDAKQNIIK